MKIFYAIAISFLTFSSYAQLSDFNKEVNWKGIEYILQEDKKLKILSEIKDNLVYYLKDNDLLKTNISNFHFLNLNNDNFLDFIYVGYSGGEQPATLAYIQNDNGYYTKIFEAVGVIYQITNITVIEPFLEIKIIKNDECYDCLGVKNSSIFLWDKNSFKLIETVSFTQSTALPIIEFKKHFRVVSPEYYLRSSAIISNEGKEPDVLFGNVIAEYGTGALGYALASQKDETGRIWWFVVIKANESIRAVFKNREGYYMGWMSSRYLEEF